MAAGVPARLTAAQGRKFGLTVGGAFLVLSAIAWWRGHPITVTVLGSLGAVLAVAGLVVPTMLGPVEKVAARIREYVDAGFTTQIVEVPAPYDPETLERLIGEVQPLVERA